MDASEIIKKILGLDSACEIDDANVEKEWIQVGKLSAEETARRRALTAAKDEGLRDIDLLKKKVAAITANLVVLRDEFWRDLHKAHGLLDGNYHMHEDGRIFMEPNKKK